MVGQSRRKATRRQLLGSHQRCWIWGRHAVLETLRAARWIPLEVALADRLPPEELAHARRLARAAGADPTVEPADELTRRCRTAEHQGYLAKMPPFPYADPAPLIERAEALVLLDAVQDPYNFGAVVRSADVLGLDGLIVGTARQSEVSSLVARSSAGAVNHVPIARADDLDATADRLRRVGFRLVAASEKAAAPPWSCDFRRRTALIIGNEGTGVRPSLVERCDELVAIPQSGHVGSLNAAVAAGILFYEVRRQRTGESR